MISTRPEGCAIRRASTFDDKAGPTTRPMGVKVSSSRLVAAVLTAAAGAAMAPFRQSPLVSASADALLLGAGALRRAEGSPHPSR